MDHRSPARWMAPLALLVVSLAFVFVITSSTDDGPQESPPAAEQSQEDAQTETQTQKKQRTSKERTSTGGGSETTASSDETTTYTVEAGDTLGSIAEEHGLTVEQLIEANPEVDPQSLNVGQRIEIPAG